MAQGILPFKYQISENDNGLTAIAQERLRDFGRDEGVVFIGIAQEKFSTFRSLKKLNEKTGKRYDWLCRGMVMCNQFYFYLVDEDFGPMFIKFSSYFPYTGRVCINGHEYAKRQLDKEGIAYEALDNGFLSCENPQRLQEILDDLDERKIDMVFRKWLRRLPHPFTDRNLGKNFGSMLRRRTSWAGMRDVRACRSGGQIHGATRAGGIE